MIINGKAIAEEILHELAIERKTFSKPPRLGIVICARDAATESFVRIKTQVGKRLEIDMVPITLPEHVATEAVISSVKQLARECDGVIVQLPLPAGLDTEKVLAAIPQGRDVDVINPTVPTDKHTVRPPVAGAVAEILKRTGVDARDKHAVVVGEGMLVGAPCAALLRALGAKVIVITKETNSLHELARADIIVSGAGVPGLIKPDMIKESVVLIDAGTSEQAGKLAGDADPACADKSSVFTPVPGGVGPVAVATIFKNLFTLIKHPVIETRSW